MCYKFKSVPKPEKVCEWVPKLEKVWESVLKLQKVCQNLRKYEKVCQNLRKCVKSLKSVPKHEKGVWFDQKWLPSHILSCLDLNWVQIGPKIAISGPISTKCRSKQLKIQSGSHICSQFDPIEWIRLSRFDQKWHPGQILSCLDLNWVQFLVQFWFEYVIVVFVNYDFIKF